VLCPPATAIIDTKNTVNAAAAIPINDSETSTSIRLSPASVLRRSSRRLRMSQLSAGMRRRVPLLPDCSLVDDDT